MVEQNVEFSLADTDVYTQRTLVRSLELAFGRLTELVTGRQRPVPRVPDLP